MTMELGVASTLPVGETVLPVGIVSLPVGVIKLPVGTTEPPVWPDISVVYDRLRLL